MNRRSFIQSAGLLVPASVLGTTLSGRSVVTGRSLTSVGVASTSPSGIANMELWFDPATGVTLDGSSRVSQFVEKKNGVVFAQATAGSRPEIVASAINSLPAIASDATSRWLTSGNLPTYGDYTIFVVMKSSGSNYFLSKGVDAVLREFFLLNINNSLIGAFHSFDGTGLYQHSLQAVQFSLSGTAGFRLYCIRKNGMHIRVWENGVVHNQTNAGSCPSAIGKLNGFYTFLGYNSTGTTNTQIAEMMVFSRPLSSVEMATCNDYLAAKFAISSSMTSPDLTHLPGIFWLGDSQFVGVGGVPPSTRFMEDASVGVNQPTRIYDYGINAIGGRQAQEITDGVPYEELPSIDNGDYVFLWCTGSNSFRLGGQTGAQVIASLDSTVSQLFASGKSIKVMVLTCLNCSLFTAAQGSVSGPDSGHQKTVNDYLRLGVVGGHAVTVCDLQVVTELNDSLNTTYFVDGAHPTVAGYGIVSDRMKTSYLTM